MASWSIGGAGSYLPSVPQGEVSVDDVARMVPEGYRIRTCAEESRYQVYFGRHFCRSRSWELYGKRAALLLICREAWAHYVELRAGEACPIVGLMSVGGAASASAA